MIAILAVMGFRFQGKTQQKGGRETVLSAGDGTFMLRFFGVTLFLPLLSVAGYGLE